MTWDRQTDAVLTPGYSAKPGGTILAPSLGIDDTESGGALLARTINTLAIGLVYPIICDTTTTATSTPTLDTTVPRYKVRAPWFWNLPSVDATYQAYRVAFLGSRGSAPGTLWEFRVKCLESGCEVFFDAFDDAVTGFGWHTHAGAPIWLDDASDWNEIEIECNGYNGNDPDDIIAGISIYPIRMDTFPDIDYGYARVRGLLSGVSGGNDFRADAFASVNSLQRATLLLQDIYRRRTGSIVTSALCGHGTNLFNLASGYHHRIPSVAPSGAKSIRTWVYNESGASGTFNVQIRPQGVDVVLGSGVSGSIANGSWGFLDTNIIPTLAGMGADWGGQTLEFDYKFNFNNNDTFISAWWGDSYVNPRTY